MELYFFFCSVAENSQKNKMTLDNLSLVFGADHCWIFCRRTDGATNAPGDDEAKANHGCFAGNQWRLLGRLCQDNDMQPLMLGASPGLPPSRFFLLNKKGSKKWFFVSTSEFFYYEQEKVSPATVQYEQQKLGPV